MVLKSFIIFISMMVCTTLYGKHTSTYFIDKTYYDVVAAVERLANEPRKTKFKIPNLPAIIDGKDIVVQTYFRYYANTHTRYYKVRIKLAHPIGKMWKFNKTLEVWGEHKGYTIRSTIDIGWGRNNKCWIIAGIKQRILNRAENMILSMEKSKIKSYSKRIETVEVEQEDSWIMLINEAWELGTRFVEKFNNARS